MAPVFDITRMMVSLACGEANVPEKRRPSSMSIFATALDGVVRRSGVVGIAHAADVEVGMGCKAHRDATSPQA
jgi:hypothetical protein